MDDPMDGAATDPVLSNGWRGEPATGTLGGRFGRWAVGARPERGVTTLAPPEVEPWDWTHHQVGWGLVLAANDAMGATDLAAARDAPEPLQDLVKERGPAPVLRWTPARPDVLLRHYPGYADPEPIPIGGSPRGTGPGALPAFLMLWGGLDVLPWRLQYTLNLDPRIFAGRLPLTGEPLARYVTHLLGPWNAPAAGPMRALVWATDHGGGDMSRLMRAVVADPVHEKYAADPDITVSYRPSAEATAANLATDLAAGRPGMVVTTSHGFTGPPGAPDPDRLGWLVDAALTPADPHHLLDPWQPAGALWYAHACCGAGADAPSTFSGLFDAGSSLGRMIDEVAAMGSRVAPLPVALLGATEPLRAFVGHVEPTYDWTIRDQATRHALTADLVQALYDDVMRGRPVGWALSGFHLRAGAEAAALDDVRSQVLNGTAEPISALQSRLRFLDRRSLVVLGDPAVALPAAGPG